MFSHEIEEKAYKFINMYTHWMKCFKYLNFSTSIHPITRGGGSKRFEKVYLSQVKNHQNLNIFSGIKRKFNLGGKTYLVPRAVTKTIQSFFQRLSLLF